MGTFLTSLDKVAAGSRLSRSDKSMLLCPEIDAEADYKFDGRPNITG
jgi:hypothetical protein